MKPKYHLTFEVTTEKSAEHGDFARIGCLPRSGEIPRRTYHPKNPHRFTLREALEILERHNSGYAPPEADCCPVSTKFPPRWITVRGETDAYPGMPDALSVSIHLPDALTNGSRVRIARLLGCYGLDRTVSTATA